MTDKAQKYGEAGAREVRIRWTHCAVLAAVCALVIGVLAASAGSGAIELLGLKAENTYYNRLVQGFSAGQLSLKQEAPAGLAQLVDPYDPAASFPYRWMDASPIHDLSYYKGRLYLYFGVIPTLVLFWPYAALTGHYLFHKDAVVIFFSAGFLASVGLMFAVWRRYFAEVSVGVVAAGTLALGLANFAPAILGRCDVYEVAISCGYSLTTLALAAIWGALHDSRRRNWWLAAASLAYGLAVGARPSLLFGAVILLAPVAWAWRERRQIWVPLLAAAAPIMLIGMGLMLYNDLRFDSPLEFGQRYQLAARRQGAMQQFGLGYLWFNFRVSFLEPARWSGRFPFLQDIAVPPLPTGYDTVEHAFGALTNIPLVWLALAAPLVWRKRPVEARSTLRWFLAAVALLFGISALTLALHQSMCLRYEAEFLPALMLLAVVGILGLERTLAGRPAWGRAARLGWGLLLVYSVAFNLLITFEVRASVSTSLGLLHFERGGVDKAIPHFRKALEILPGSAEANNNLGNVLLAKGQVDEAIRHYQKALEARPEDAMMHNNLGNVFLAKGQWDEAISHYQTALKTRPEDAMIHKSLGEVLLQIGRPDEAIAHFRKALEIQPNNATIHYNLGNLLLQNGRTDDAIVHFQKALEIQPDNAWTHGNLGNILLEKGQVDEAIVHYQKALQVQPDSANTHNNLAAGLLRKGRVREAITHYQTAVKLQPDDVNTLSSLAWVLATFPEATLRNGAQAIELAQHANQLSGGNDPTILSTLAAAEAEAGRYPEAVTTVQRAIQLAAAQTNTALVNTLQMHLGSYQSGSPLRDAGQAIAPPSRGRP